mmetsp:Transcript_25173/g.63899  ORF Transcript_25173/g.63899 Transcript_25173/m.63899 type:complete len:256 (+) Transcript_25173:1090-1857(+)
MRARHTSPRGMRSCRPCARITVHSSVRQLFLPGSNRGVGLLVALIASRCVSALAGRKCSAFFTRSLQSRSAQVIVNAPSMFTCTIVARYHWPSEYMASTVSPSTNEALIPRLPPLDAMPPEVVISTSLSDGRDVDPQERSDVAEGALETAPPDARKPSGEPSSRSADNGLRKRPRAPPPYGLVASHRALPVLAGIDGEEAETEPLCRRCSWCWLSRCSRSARSESPFADVPICCVWVSSWGLDSASPMAAHQSST